MGGQLVESRGALMGIMLGLQLDVMRAGAEMQYAVAAGVTYIITWILVSFPLHLFSRRERSEC